MFIGVGGFMVVGMLMLMVCFVVDLILEKEVG